VQYKPERLAPKPPGRGFGAGFPYFAGTVSGFTLIKKLVSELRKWQKFGITRVDETRQTKDTKEKGAQ
jgi:hypothetical protein